MIATHPVQERPTNVLRALVTLTLFGLILLLPAALKAEPRVFRTTGTMVTPRSEHTATLLLPSGKVLVAGGRSTTVLATAELYDPATGAWSATGSMSVPRVGHRATVLSDGRVLVTGGTDGSNFHTSAELYDPTSGTWSATGSMLTARSSHTATLLASGKVLVASGRKDAANLTATAELYDPTTGQFAATGNLIAARRVHTATRLTSGHVLVAGGRLSGSATSSAELYDPATGAWAFTGFMTTASDAHEAVALADGTVLHATTGANGVASCSGNSQLYDGAAFAATGSLPGGRRSHALTLLDGATQALLTGGAVDGLSAAVFVYDTSTEQWSATSALNHKRQRHTATLLLNGEVLAAGGVDGDGNTVGEAEIWTADESFNPVDGNGDTIADTTQANVFTVRSALGNSLVTLASAPGTTLAAAGALQNPACVALPSVPFPLGFFEFAVTNVTPGGATTVQLFLPPGTNPTTFYKFGATPGDPTPHWYEFLYDGTTGAQISGDLVTLHFVDGQRGDDDLAANGVILDAGGPSPGPPSDLVATAVSDPPAILKPGDTFSVTDTVQNQGTGSAAASTVRYFLINASGSKKDLKGGRDVAGLAPTGISTDSTTVTVLAGTAPGIYKVRACADGDKLITETDEKNNCIESVGSVEVQTAPDLVVLAVSDPPANAAPGGQFTVNDTVKNQGAADAGASTVRYYLSNSAGKKDLGGSRAVGVLTPTQESIGTGTTVTILSGTAAGTYSLMACADDTKVVGESNEKNNCATSATTLTIGATPDLIVTAVSNPPATGKPGDSFAVNDTVKNQGGAAAGASTVRYYLSDASGKRDLGGSRAVGALNPTQESAAVGTVVSIISAPAGTYSLVACADDTKAVAEGNEQNNCKTSATTIIIAGAPDLVITAVSNPPATGKPGDSFAVNDTAKNQGSADAGASTVRYYLSNSAGKKDLGGSRAVGVLTPNQESAGVATTVTIVNAAPGTYSLMACSDDTKVVAEANEKNNCKTAAATIEIGGAPDLVVTAVSDPPGTGKPGDQFAVNETVKNQGGADAGASTVRYYLSNSAGKKDLGGSRAVGALTPNQESGGVGTMVTIQGNVAPGPYSLVACADDVKVVPESNEKNNCKTSANVIQIQAAPDLVVTAVNNPPASARPGDKFNVNDTVKNQGAADAGPSTVRYYLSNVDGKKDLNGSRAVGALTPTQESIGSATEVTIPSGVLPGIYSLLACADDTKVVAESVEGNNCKTSTSTVEVKAAPDLVVTAISNPPLSGKPGDQFSVDETVKNQGAADAGASTTRYYLSNLAGKKDLGGSRNVPLLAPTQESAGVGTVVTILGGVAPGTYSLMACADDLKDINESNDGNNCKTSATTIEIQAVADLVVTVISNPPVSGKPGDQFTVDETVKNQGAASAGASTVRYYLSNSAGKKDLGGSRAVGSLVPNAESPGVGTVVTVLSGTAAGTYSLIACADDTKIVAESSEGNNCKTAATTIQIQGAPDLVVSAISDPPATLKPGDQFGIDETVLNQGLVDAGASTVRYYLSGSSGKKDLKGSRDVALLPAGQSAPGQALVTVIAGTAPGFYSVLACADDLQVVAENNEKNNCRTAANVVEILPAPDLVVSEISDPPATANPGGQFTVIDTVANQGLTDATDSTVRYYLVNSAGKKDLSGSRVVGVLAPSATSEGQTVVTILANTAPGTYSVHACADDLKVIAESNEKNNCTQSLTKIDIVP